MAGLDVYPCRLKQFDQSSAASRIISQAATPPVSVVGIGNKGEWGLSEVTKSQFSNRISATKLLSLITPRQRLFWQWYTQRSLLVVCLSWDNYRLDYLLEVNHTWAINSCDTLRSVETSVMHLWFTEASQWLEYDVKVRPISYIT